MDGSLALLFVWLRTPMIKPQVKNVVGLCYIVRTFVMYWRTGFTLVAKYTLSNIQQLTFYLVIKQYGLIHHGHARGQSFGPFKVQIIIEQALLTLPDWGCLVCI